MRSGARRGPVDPLFRYKAKPRGIGAKVGSYLAVLTASSVGGMLRRRARLATSAQAVREPNAARPWREQRHLRRWEDDGGRVRRAP